jgi:hypothetical protein
MKLIRTFAPVVLATLLATSLTGCFKHSYTVGSGGNTSGDAKYSKWHSHFLYGLIGEKDVAIRDVCPSGNGTVKDEVSFVNGLVGALIGLIYYPTTVEVYCAEGGHAEVKLTPKTMRAIASDPVTADVVQGINPAKARELAEAREHAKSTGSL